MAHLDLRSRARRAARVIRAFAVRQNWPFVALLLATLVLPAAVLGPLAWHERAALLRDGEHVAVRTASSIAEHVQMVLETHALVLEQVDAQLAGRSWADLERDTRLRRNLTRLVEQFPQVLSIRLIDGNGVLRQFSTGGVELPRHGSSLRDTDFFRAHQQRGERLFISAPFSDRTGTRQFSFSMRRSTADGSFDGLVSVSVQLSYFTDFWRSVAPDVAHVIPLLKADGTLLVRHPMGHPPRLPADSPLLQQIARSPAGGYYTAVSRIDGVERMNAYLRVGRHPLYVSYSMDKADWLQPWRTRAWMYAVLGVLTTIALASVAVMALRKARAQRAAARAALMSARRSRAEMRQREGIEAQLVQAQKMEAIGQLTGGVAHDFNNLLHVMSLNVHMAQRVGTDPKVARCLENIGRSVERATQLTRQLTAFARKQKLAPTSFAPAGLIVRMADLLHRTLGGHIAFEIDAAPDVASVYADPAQTELALLNLAVNARDAMPSGGRLTFRLRNLAVTNAADIAPGSYVELAIADTGCGMPPDVLDRAFEPFFTTKDVGKGTGLGLSMVHGFARQSGGTARIESRPGVGTTVSLLLPQGREEVRVEARTASPAPAAATAARVLLVDDDSLVRASMLLSLREAGYHVEEAAGGAEALGLLAGRRPDVLVTDFAMPGMNGIQLAQALRAMHPSLPVVLVTGYAQPMRDDSAAWVDVVLHKPFRDGELVGAIEDLVRRSRRQSAGAPVAPSVEDAVAAA